MGLALGHPPVTSDVPFAVRSCNWGHTLDYLDTTPTDDNGTAGTSVAATPAPGASVSLRGWAGDERTGRPARAVLVVVNGAVIDRIEPQLDRPDVAQVTGHPGFETSGFSDVLPVPGWTPGSIVSVYALGADGTASRIDTRGGATPPTLDLGEGQTARVAQGALSGSVDALGVVPSPITLTPPPGRSWSDFHWMEIRARAGSFRDGSLVITDGVAAPGHSIVVEVGSRSPAVIIVPVGSCAQWHGYGAGGGLSLQADHPDDIAAVRLLP
jgi:hypothetical protein